jgi:hypothetical protein
MATYSQYTIPTVDRFKNKEYEIYQRGYYYKWSTSTLSGSSGTVDYKSSDDYGTQSEATGDKPWLFTAVSDTWWKLVLLSAFYRTGSVDGGENFTNTNGNNLQMNLFVRRYGIDDEYRDQIVFSTGDNSINNYANNVVFGAGYNHGVGTSENFTLDQYKSDFPTICLFPNDKLGIVYTHTFNASLGHTRNKNLHTTWDLSRYHTDYQE